MNATQKRRVLKLAAFLDKLPRRKFNIDRIVTKSRDGRGTVCCAIGWLPAIFPRHFKWRKNSMGNLYTSHKRNLGFYTLSAIAEEFFGLPAQIFIGPEDLDDAVSPKKVAKKCRKAAERE